MPKQTIIARPYAKAAFETALLENSVKAWSELLKLAAFVVKQPLVQSLLDNPKMTAHQCCEFLLAVCKAKLTAEGENFFRLLTRYKRFAILPEIDELFEQYRDEQERLIKINVVSALTLSDQEQKDLTQALKKRLQREIILKCSVDKDLIGGLIIQADDLVIDGSIRGKLARLKTELLT